MKRQEIFSIRKLSVGAASVLLGTLLFVGQGQTVAANEQVEDLTVQESTVDDGTVEDPVVQEVAVEEPAETPEVSAVTIAVEEEPAVENNVTETVEAEKAEKPVEDVEVSSLFADEVEKEEKTVLAAQTEDRQAPQLISVKTDKTEYKAGETVVITVEASDETDLNYVRAHFYTDDSRLELNAYSNNSDIIVTGSGNYRATLTVKIPINRPNDTYTLTYFGLEDSIGFSAFYYVDELERKGIAVPSFNVKSVPAEEQVGSVLVKYQVIDENNNVIDTLKEIYAVEKQKDESYYSFYEYPDYNLEIDGKTYVLESSLSAGNYQSGYIVGGETIEVNYYYREEKYGSVVVRYLTVDEKDNTVSTVIKEINVADMQREGDWVGYTNYDDRIEYDGKIYVLDYANSDDTFFDIAVVGNETLEYNYYYNEAKLGSVLVRRHFVDTDGQVTSLLSEEYAVQNGIEGDYYYTDSPYDFEVNSGYYRLVYDLTQGDTEGTIVGDETKVVDYYYRSAMGSVLVRYHILDENDNVISTPKEIYAVENQQENTHYYFDNYQDSSLNIDDKIYVLDGNRSDSYYQSDYIVGGQTKEVNYYYREQKTGSVLVRRYLVDNENQVISLLTEEYAVQNGIEGDYYYTDNYFPYELEVDGGYYRRVYDLTQGETEGTVVGNETKEVDYFYRSATGSILVRYNLIDDDGTVLDTLSEKYIAENQRDSEWYDYTAETILELEDNNYLLDAYSTASNYWSGSISGGETIVLEFNYKQLPSEFNSEFDLEAILSGDFSSLAGRWKIDDFDGNPNVIIEADGTVYGDDLGTFVYGSQLGKATATRNDDGRVTITVNNKEYVLYPAGDLLDDDYLKSDLIKDRLVGQFSRYLTAITNETIFYKVGQETVDHRLLNLEVIPNVTGTGFSLITTFADDSERQTTDLVLTITNSDGEMINFTGANSTINFDWPNIEQGIYTAYNPQFTDGIYKLTQTSRNLGEGYSHYSGETFIEIRDGKVEKALVPIPFSELEGTWKNGYGEQWTLDQRGFPEEAYNSGKGMGAASGIGKGNQFLVFLDKNYQVLQANVDYSTATEKDASDKTQVRFIDYSVSKNDEKSYFYRYIPVDDEKSETVIEPPTEEVTAIPTEAPVEDDKPEAVIDTPTEEPNVDEPVSEPEIETPTDEVTAISTEAPVEEDKPEAVIETPTEEPSTTPEVTEEPSVDEPVSEPEVETPTEEVTAIPTEAPVEEDKPEAVVDPTVEETATSPEATEEPSSEEVITDPVVEEEVSAIPDYAPEEEALPEYVFDPADFQDVLEPTKTEETPTEEATAIPTEAPVEDEKPEAVIDIPTEEPTTTPEVTEEPSAEEVVTEPVVTPEVSEQPSVEEGSETAPSTEVPTTEEDVSAIPDYAPEEAALPEYVFDPADFQDVLAPVKEAESKPIPTVKETTDKVVEKTSKPQASGGAAAAATGQAIQTASANRSATGQDSRVARATSEKTLPSTGDAGSVLTLIGLGLTSLGLAGRKRRQD